MAAPNASRSTDSVTVTITRDQREALHREISDHAVPASTDDLPNCLTWPGHGKDARRLAARITLMARLLEQIGWDKWSESATHALTLDAELIEWVRGRLQESEEFLVDEAKALAEVKAGTDPWAHPTHGRGGGTLEQDVAFLRETVDRELEFTGACHAILAQIGES